MTWRQLAIALWAMIAVDCYLEHAAEPCDAGQDLSCEAGQCDGARTYGESQESEEVGSNPATGHQCAGPIVAGECYANLHDVVSR